MPLCKSHVRNVCFRCPFMYNVLTAAATPFFFASQPEHQQSHEEKLHGPLSLIHGVLLFSRNCHLSALQRAMTLVMTKGSVTDEVNMNTTCTYPIQRLKWRTNIHFQKSVSIFINQQLKNGKKQNRKKFQHQNTRKLPCASTWVHECIPILFIFLFKVNLFPNFCFVLQYMYWQVSVCRQNVNIEHFTLHAIPFSCVSVPRDLQQTGCHTHSAFQTECPGWMCQGNHRHGPAAHPAGLLSV